MKSFEVDSSHMPLSSEIKSYVTKSTAVDLGGRFQPQVGSCFCTAATRRSTLQCLLASCFLALIMTIITHKLISNKTLTNLSKIVPHLISVVNKIECIVLDLESVQYHVVYSTSR